MLLVVEGAGMREILDLTIAFHSQREFIAKLVLKPPIDLELKTIDLRLVPELSDEERVYRNRVTAHDIFGKRSEQDFVRRMVLKRKFVDAAEGKPQAVSVPLDDLILAAKLKLPGLEVFADVLPEKALDDQLPSVGEPVLELDFVRLPAALLLSGSRIDRTVFFDRDPTLLDIGRANIELG